MEYILNYDQGHTAVNVLKIFGVGNIVDFLKEIFLDHQTIFQYKIFNSAIIFF